MTIDISRVVLVCSYSANTICNKNTLVQTIKLLILTPLSPLSFLDFSKKRCFFPVSRILFKIQQYYIFWQQYRVDYIIEIMYMVTFCIFATSQLTYLPKTPSEKKVVITLVKLNSSFLKVHELMKGKKRCFLWKV